ncbi:MAG: cysteine--tRNA ligase [Saprospirales bacterium]|jgi:cysteinyl-tRNA synthetase|nr:cysteine--tRNA ligase [Saprospirales bacterium]
MNTSDRTLKLYNSLTGKKDVFQPLHEGHAGMYVCGPTVYYDVHLGNCRTFVSFDIIYRYLNALGYQVRYVRNITDVGHLTDDGEDRMAKGARVAQLEPMEVAQKYTVGFHDMMRIFNTLPPSIEPRATGHIPEQIEMVQDILSRGYGYERNGSVYFNVRKFDRENPGIYGQLSGRVLDELMAESRDNLKSQDEKNDPADFAIWMKARPGDIMVWKSPWSVGFPGWHLECSAMSTKYLGQTFDIHGGGNDLKFPHHENEIAQNQGACGCAPARYWLHTNMLLLNGKKMSKSDGNTITPVELFTGDSPFVSKGYSPMVVKFFMLMAHYRSTLDITDEALAAAEKGYRKLMETNRILQSLRPADQPYDGSESAADRAILDGIDTAFSGMDDDFNTAIALASLSELGSFVHKIANKQLDAGEVSPWVLERLKTVFNAFIVDILALQDELDAAGDTGTVEGLMQLILDIRANARTQKDWGTSDKIRDGLAAVGISVKDGKEGTSWTKG